MIRSLHLTNFKKHSDLKINFTDGLNGIFGPNYTGKTTILYAILYALGGASHVPGTNLQKKGTNVGMGVNMVFDINGVEYLVERKKAGSYLQGDGVMLASGTSNVTAKIEELIGMPIKRFRQLKYAEQKQAHALLTVGATELHKILEELTGIDQINVAMERLKDIVSKSAGALEVLSKVDMAPLKLIEKNTHNSVVIALDDLDKLIDKQLETKRNLEQTVVERDILLKQKEIYDEWRLFHARDTATLQLYEDEIISIDKLILREDSSKIDEEEIKDLECDLEILLNSIATSKAKRVRADDLRKDVTKLEDFITKTNTLMLRGNEDLISLPEVSEKIVSAAKKLSDGLSAKCSEVELKYSDILTMLAGAKCPTCGRENDIDFDPAPLEDSSKELSNTLAKLEQDYQKAKTNYRDKKRFLSVKQEVEGDLRRNAEKLKEEGIAVTEKRNLIESLAKDTMSSVDLENSEAKAKEISKQISESRNAYNKQHGYLLRIEELADLKKTLQENLAKLKKPSFDPKWSKTVEEDFKTYSEQMEKHNNDVADANSLLSGFEEDLRSTRKQIQQAEQDNSAYEAANKRNSVAKELQKYLRNNRDRYIGKVWDFFLGSASTFVSNCTNGMITEIQRTDNGQFQFVEDDQVMGIKDASGAQEAIMGLAVQMALAEASQCPLDVLLVDEPTADMDADHSMAVVGMLSTKGRQVIAISHREMDASLCKKVVLLGD